MITAIVAYDEKRGIGKDGKIPWKIKEEMAHFVATTMGYPVIMGRKTWDSLPEKYRPLPSRTNYVVSSMYLFDPIEPDSTYRLIDGARWTQDLADAIDSADRLSENVFIIGGGQLYRDALEWGWVDQVIASEVKGDFGCDTFFPELSSDWARVVLKSYDDFEVVKYIKDDNEEDGE